MVIRNLLSVNRFLRAGLLQGSSASRGRPDSDVSIALDQQVARDPGTRRVFCNNLVVSPRLASSIRNCESPSVQAT